MKSIAEAIQERRQAILRLQAEVEVLEKAAPLLNGHAAKVPDSLITPHSGRLGIRGRRPRLVLGHPMKGKTNPKSTIGMTVAVLRESGMPLHIAEILTRVKKRGGDAKKASLVSSLIRLSKKGHIFCKTDQPATFGLAEWKQAKALAPPAN